MDYLVRALMALVPVIALTVVGRQLGYRGLYLAAPAVLALAFTLLWSLPLIQFLLRGAPVGAMGVLKALTPNLREGVWSAVTVLLLVLAIFGVRPPAATPAKTAD